MTFRLIIPTHGRSLDLWRGWRCRGVDMLEAITRGVSVTEVALFLLHCDGHYVNLDGMLMMVTMCSGEAAI